jgi:hypothetical protein
MRIIQSFWSCNQTDLTSFNAGWLSPEYHLMGWALSCLQLKQYYPEVVLYTDTVGAKMLIDTLKLPYTDVICELDKFSGIHNQLWALPKIDAYARQNKTFLHVDGDVFIWKKFSPEISEAGLIAQNKEVSTNYYETMLKSLELTLTYLPPEIAAERKKTSTIYAYNAGILGGSDINFFQSYTSKAREFIDRNVDVFSRISVFNFNIFYEQYLFYCLANEADKKVAVVFDEIFGDSHYKGFGDFIEVPHNKHYVHLLGNYKRTESVCERMATRLRQDHPEYYYRIIGLFKQKKLPLRKDHYWFESDNSEQALLLKHHLLKNGYNKEKKSANGIDGTVKRPDLQSAVYGRSLALKAEVELYLSDLNQFEDALWKIVHDKFSSIPNNQLLARDLACIDYLEYVFRDLQTIYEKVIVSDDLVESIGSRYDWTTKDSNFTIHQIVGQEHGSEVRTLVVPECEQQGYSLINIDELDLLILQKLQEPKTIKDLFKSIEFAFDADDLASSKPEFEKLILGRIKSGLANKSIKVATGYTV